ncbi:glycosyltransferase family 4 protein [Aerococcus urinae]
MIKILLITPSGKGGISSVTDAILADKSLLEHCDIDYLETVVEGNKIKKLYKAIKAFIYILFNYKSYDVFHIQMSEDASFYRKSIYIYLLRLLGRKEILVHMHAPSFDSFYEKSKHKLYIKNTLKKAKLVLALSVEWSEFYRNKLELKNVKVLTNGIDIDLYKTGISSPVITHKNFAFLGFLGERKGIYDLIEAFRTICKSDENIKLYVGGNGEVEEVKKLIKKYDLENNVYILGWINLKDKLKLFSKVSTLILPSYAEGVPISILEAMACHKAIITSNVGGIPSIINNGGGDMIKAGDIEKLSFFINKYSSDLEYLKNKQKEAEANSKENYDIHSIHQKLYEYYKDCIQED